MRRFRFRLTKVLRVRAHRERAARRALAEELSALGALEDALVHVDNNLLVCQDDDSASQAAELARALEAGLMTRRQGLERDIRTTETRVESARSIYRDTRVDHRAMQNLRERQLETWQREVEAEIQGEFEEIARTQYLRKRREKATT